MSVTVFENFKSLIKSLFLCALPLAFALIAKRYTENVTAYASAICALIALLNIGALTLLKSYRNPALCSIQLRTSEMTSSLLIITSSLLLSVAPSLKRNLVQFPLFWLAVIGFCLALFLFFLDLGLEVMLSYQSHRSNKKAEARLE